MSFVEKWKNCTRCSVGVSRSQRISVDANRYRTQAPVVLGTGEPGGVMFVGDPVSEFEESMKQPFSSMLFDPVQKAIGVLRQAKVPVYYTHALACRPCIPVLNYNNEPKVDPRTRLPIYKDILPPKEAQDACRERLHEEIYEVDPKLIVALGSDSLKALTGKHPTGLNRGQIITLSLKGKTQIPSLNAKGVWERKVRVGGKMVLSRPTEPLKVDYSVYLTGKLHPVLSYRASEDPDREREQFTYDMIQILRIWKMLDRMKES